MLGPNHSMVHNIANIGGYEANVIKEYSEFMNLSEGKPLDDLRILMEVTHISKLTNLLNLKYIFISPEGGIEYHPAIKLVSKNSKYTLLKIRWHYHALLSFMHRKLCREETSYLKKSSAVNLTP